MDGAPAPVADWLHGMLPGLPERLLAPAARSGRGRPEMR